MIKFMYIYECRTVISGVFLCLALYCEISEPTLYLGRREVAL